MNIDLLQGSPDWWGYILSACVAGHYRYYLVHSKCIPMSIIVLDDLIAETDTYPGVKDSW